MISFFLAVRYHWCFLASIYATLASAVRHHSRRITCQLFGIWWCVWRVKRAQRTHEYYEFYCIFKCVVSNLPAVPCMEQTTMKQSRVATTMTLKTRKAERGSSNTSPAIKRVPARCVPFLFPRPSVKTLHFLHAYFSVYQRHLGNKVFISYDSYISHSLLYKVHSTLARFGDVWRVPIVC